LTDLLIPHNLQPATPASAFSTEFGTSPSALITEVVLTAMFLVVILGVTHKNAPAGFAPLAIGLALTLIHLISIPVTNTSVNPARSTAVALSAEPWALQQLWLFWVAPIVGGVIGALVHKAISED
jgi:aquaporin Z